MSEYKCCFDDAKNCSVRNMWKLKPESLVGFCKLCKKETPIEPIYTQLFEFIAKILADERSENMKLRNLLTEIHEK